MNRLGFTKHVLIVACLLSGSSLSAGAEPGAATATWKKLTYEASGWIGSSNIQIELLESSPRELQAATPEPLGEAPLQSDPQRILVMDIQARADSAISKHRSRVRIWFDAASGAVMQREKIRSGKKPYRKVYRFAENGASRLKQMPRSRDEAGEPAQTWSKTRQSTYPYDLQDTGCATVTDPALILYLLSTRDSHAPSTPPPRCVFFDDALYRVSFTVRDGERLPVSYRDNTDGKNAQDVSDSRAVRHYRLGVAPLTPGADRKDFELLELRGDIVITMDPQAGIPVQLAGDRPGVARITIPLIELQRLTVDSDNGDQQ